MKTDPEKVAEYLQAQPNRTVTDATIAREVLGWVNRSSDNTGFNHRAKRIERAVVQLLPGTKRWKGNGEMLWRYEPPTPQARTRTLRGQGTVCHGKLTIELSGPQGCGKSLVARVLKMMLPLLAVDEVEIIERQP